MRTRSIRPILSPDPDSPAADPESVENDLEFLPAGDARLSRRAKAASSQYAVIVRFSRTRRRYERQGLLVEPSALAEAR